MRHRGTSTGGDCYGNTHGHDQHRTRSKRTCGFSMRATLAVPDVGDAVASRLMVRTAVDAGRGNRDATKALLLERRAAETLLDNSSRHVSVKPLQEYTTRPW